MKILLVRADGIGDALVCAPLLAALRSAGHTVGAVLGTRNRAIFAPETLAWVHVLERIAWPAHGSTRGSYATALAHAWAIGYDVALVASEEPEAYAFARDARISRRIGFTNGWEKPLKTIAMRRMLTRAIVRPASARRVREHEVRTIFRLGAEFVDEHLPTRDVGRLRAIVLGARALDATDERSEDATVNRSSDASLNRTIVVQASMKLAPAGLNRAAFTALAIRLREGGRDVTLCGDEATLVRTIASASGARAACDLDVVAWKTLVAGARAVITPDSGAAHVAGMLGVPVVDAFAPGRDTATDARRWAPWASIYRTVVLDPARDATAIAIALADALDLVLAREVAA